MNKRRRRIGKFRRLAARRIQQGKWLTTGSIARSFLDVWLTPLRAEDMGHVNAGRQKIDVTSFQG